MNGKDKCNLLREIRKRIAAQYGLTYQPTECHHEGDCAGTCPKCDAELQDLQRQLKEKGIENIELDRQMEEMVDSFNPGSDTDNDLIALQGEAAPPEYDNKIEVTEGMPVPPPEGMSIFPEPKKKRAFSRNVPLPAGIFIIRKTFGTSCMKVRSLFWFANVPTSTTAMQWLWH